MKDEITSLEELNLLRSAPILNRSEKFRLTEELIIYVKSADWLTVGIMAPSSKLALLAIREIEDYFNWESMKVIIKPKIKAPVFLKANQKSGDIYIRVEHGLGEGILLTCQNDKEIESSKTIGPLPLDFFKRSSLSGK